jgi:hypothetical protein
VTEDEFINHLSSLTAETANAQDVGELSPSVDKANTLLMAVEGALRAGEIDALYQTLMPGVVTMANTIRYGLNLP